MTPDQFETIARKAIDSLPELYRPYVQEIMLCIEPHASDELLKELDVPPDEDICGLYEGTSLTERSWNDGAALPPRITLYYEPLLDDCDTEEELIREIQKTVLHEVGHHFGLDEEQLERLGYG